MVRISVVFLVLGIAYLALGFIYKKDYKRFNENTRAIFFYGVTMISFWFVIIDIFISIKGINKALAIWGANITLIIGLLQLLRTIYICIRDKVDSHKIEVNNNKFILFTIGIYFLSTALREWGV